MKVLTHEGNLYAADAQMRENRAAPDIDSKPAALSVPQGMTVTPIEASGIYCDSMHGQYIIVSDETEHKVPVLFLMDDNGVVRAKKVIRGVPEINDMESITKGPDGFFYCMTSQSHNRKGRLSASRKLLLRVSCSPDGEFSATGTVSPYDLLSDAATRENDSEWARFFLSGVRDKSIDIEGIAFFSDTLLLGFKDPKLRQNAVVLGIRNPATLFDGTSIVNGQVFVWKLFPLYDSLSGCFCGISDLYMHKNGLLVGAATGVSRSSGVKEDIGMIWSYDIHTGITSIKRHFPGLKPEGITYNESNGEYCIVFDNGSKNPSYYMKVKAPL